MFCGQCGTKVKDDASFCPKCGTKLRSAATSLQSAAPVVSAGEPEAAAQMAGQAPAANQMQAAAQAGSAAAQAGSPAIQAGGPVAQAGSPAVQAGYPAIQAGSASGQSGNVARAAKKRKKNAAIIAAVAAVVVLAIGLGGGIWWKTAQDAKAATQFSWEQAHTSVITLVPLEAPGFDDAATSIPVQVTGTDLDGNTVNEVQFLRPASRQITTLQGTYDLSFPGGYFTGAGKVVRTPEGSRHIEVTIPDSESAASVAIESTGSADAASEASSSTDAASEQADTAASTAGEASGSTSAADAASEDSGSADAIDPASLPVSTAAVETIGFAEVPDLEATDELIAEIREWAAQDPQDGGKADSLSQAAAGAHATAVAEEERRQAEEAARRAEEEAREREAAELQSVLASLDGWWASAGQSGSLHDYIHEGKYESFYDGSPTNSPAERSGGGTIIVERASDSFMAESGKAGETVYIVHFSEGGGYLWLESEPDTLTFVGYPPSMKNYSGSSSRVRSDPPANVLAIA